MGTIDIRKPAVGEHYAAQYRILRGSIQIVCRCGRCMPWTDSPDEAREALRKHLLVVADERERADAEPLDRIEATRALALYADEGLPVYDGVNFTGPRSFDLRLPTPEALSLWLLVMDADADAGHLDSGPYAKARWEGWDVWLSADITPATPAAVPQELAPVDVYDASVEDEPSADRSCNWLGGCPNPMSTADGLCTDHGAQVWGGVS